ncbi:PREDICTED: vacuolar protein-sorting-associated protein 25 isoform X1 [Miniopterus natalensis]|uniref:vacuolar protein-sorting-associated protein 25 isoform X1 n=1 Tax=Miniopterus natalensis TaxID=291302 RepID=UPI0007A6D991|nr:PREDICTED: vacuolar protein-sorting-associated protein 25 isoform X1 [Miniopterus natalensis]
MAMSFEWPWQYRFPPFFTLQPNVDTRQKQLAAWCSLVLSFCRLHKQSSMTVMEAQESPLFNNVKLQRKLPVESIQVVLEELRKKGNLEWLDKNKSSFLIMWRRPEEWGKLIYQWVRLFCCNDKYMAKENCICAQQIPGVPRARLSKVGRGRMRKCRCSREDSFSDSISKASQKFPFIACWRLEAM